MYQSHQVPDPSSSSHATWKLTAHSDDTACARLWSTDPEG